MIDKNPAVGRYLFDESPYINFTLYGGFLGKITKVSGKRIYYVRRDGDMEHFVNKCGAVCDTEEEVAMLRDYMLDCMEEFSQLKAKQTQNGKNRFGL